MTYDVLYYIFWNINYLFKFSEEFQIRQWDSHLSHHLCLQFRLQRLHHHPLCHQGNYCHNLFQFLLINLVQYLINYFFYLSLQCILAAKSSSISSTPTPSSLLLKSSRIFLFVFLYDETQ